MVDVSQAVPQTKSSQGLELWIEHIPGTWGLRIHLDSDLTEQVLWFNSRFHINPSPRSREVWLDVVNPETGKRLAMTCIDHVNDAEPSDYTRLYPGSRVVSENAADCYFAGKPGRWRVVAHYQDSSQRIPAPPVGTLWFSGELISEPIEVDIPPCPGGPCK